MYSAGIEQHFPMFVENDPEPDPEPELEGLRDPDVDRDRDRESEVDREPDVELVEDVEDLEQHEHLPLDVGISHHLRLLHLREGLPVNTDRNHSEEGPGSLATR